MNRREFMNELESLLLNVSEEERKEALQYYEDYFDDAGEENENEVIEKLGSPSKVAKSIQNDLSQNDERGEFTERGYHSGDEVNPFEVMDTKNQEKDINETKISNERTDANKDGFPIIEENKQENTQNWGDNTQNRNDKNNYRYDQNQNFNQNMNRNERAYNQENYRGQDNRYYERPKRKGLSAGAIILLCIFAIPVGIPVLCALFGVFIGLGAAVFGLIVGFGAAAFACILSGFLLFIIGIMKVFVIPIAGMLMIGAGLLVFGIGLLFAVLTTACVKIIPSVIRGFVSICKAPFRMGGVIA